jgi:hypothetical protein
MVVQQSFYLGLACIVAGVIIALFPSNYEIVGMEEIEEATESPPQEPAMDQEEKR